MNPEHQFSSAHDDPLVPLQDRDQAEYDPKKGYPNRFNDIGDRGERSVIHRISQFGITEQDVAVLGVDNLLKISDEQYDVLIREALGRQFETTFTSIFNHWEKLPHEVQRDHIRRTAERYKTWGFNLIQRVGVGHDAPNMVIALEGADAVESIAHIQEFHDLGVGCIGPQYNNENKLGTTEGLTTLGSEAVVAMLHSGIIVDLAHAMPAVRQDIIDLVEDEIENKGNPNAGKLLMYTHGATAEDIAQDPQFSVAAEKRGLSEAEVKRIIRLGGVIGLGVSRPFFQSVDAMVDRIDQICQLDPERGPKSLVIGSDFGGVAPEWLIGISSPADFARIGDGLSSRFGYDDEKISDILRRNLTRQVEESRKASTT